VQCHACLSFSVNPVGVGRIINVVKDKIPMIFYLKRLYSIPALQNTFNVNFYMNLLLRACLVSCIGLNQAHRM
jgi:hypothetical protein